MSVVREMTSRRLRRAPWLLDDKSKICMHKKHEYYPQRLQEEPLLILPEHTQCTRGED